MNNTATLSLPAVAIARLVAAVSGLQGVKFVGVTYTSKESNETARHTLILGASYKECVRNSMEQLTAKLHTLSGIDREAADALLVSFSKTLLAQDTGTEHPSYTKAGLYEAICPGLKVSRADGTFELCGLSHSKRVLVPGTYPVVNSRPLTIAKDKLRRELPIGKFRTLSLDMGHLESVRIGGNEIDVQDIS
jgi:hypothetical protein